MRNWIIKNELTDDEVLKRMNIGLQRYARIFYQLKINVNTQIIVNEKEEWGNAE